MTAKRARLYDALALLTAFIVVGLDQWTKYLVVTRLQENSIIPFPIFGHNLYFARIQNPGAAFSMLRDNSILLPIFIVVAIGVVAYLYSRIANNGPLVYKLVFGMIVGGAIGNLLDRFIRSGGVVDFISFRIPEIHFNFAIFNIADAFISVGVILLFVLVLFGGFNNKSAQNEELSSPKATTANASDTPPPSQPATEK